MNTTPDTVALVPFDADRATLAARLDSDPAWERLKIPGDRPYQKWRIRSQVVLDLYRFHLKSSTVTLPKEDGRYEDGLCMAAAFAINAVAFRLPPDTSPVLIERLTAIYRLAEPGSPIALIASGQVEPE